MQIINLGQIPYQQAHKIQLETVQAVIDGAEDTLIICHHPPVVTLGRKSVFANSITGWSGEIVEIERGGQATYHGPSQTVIYPIINLKNKGQNIAGFLAALEDSMVTCVAKYGIKATGNPNRGNPELTGLWVKDRKLASIGVAVKRWVTYHGLALNIYHDPNAFQGINPCGLNTNQMTDLETLLEKKIQREEIERSLSEYLTREIEILK